MLTLEISVIMNISRCGQRLPHSAVVYTLTPVYCAKTDRNSLYWASVYYSADRSVCKDAGVAVRGYSAGSPCSY